jgi:uncharacterized OB-fold protein
MTELAILRARIHGHRGHEVVATSHEGTLIALYCNTCGVAVVKGPKEPPPGSVTVQCGLKAVE